MKIWQELKNDMRPKVRYWLPAAAMDEEDLREEIRGLKARGFGGVELVVLSLLDPRIALGEDGWGTAHWDHMVDVAADETFRQGMTLDIAIGPGWPIASPAITNADDPAAIRELTFGELRVTGPFDGPLPERRKIHPEGTPERLCVIAYRETADHVLQQESFTDLSAFVQEDHLTWTPPEAGIWVVFVFYCQPAVHKINAGQTFVVDHHNTAGVKAVEAYWDQVFADRKPYESMESFFCDSLEYETSLDWTADFPEEFARRRGYSILPYLPVLGLPGVFPAQDLPGYCFEEKAVSDRINRDYVEALSQCYCEYHLAGLEKMAEKYGKTVRYQVAYNKTLEVERSGLYVALPENEALGRPSVDYMKTMAASAHIAGKQRHSFECAAEFGHSYGQSYEDLFWWVKRAAMAGMNAQVLHGASYSGGWHGSPDGRIPGTEWPGFEAFGKFVSNYWNRTPSIADARGCLDAITRINAVFRETAKVDILIFRDDYLSNGFGSEFCLYPDDGLLSNHGYSYEFASEAVLERSECVVEDGCLSPEGPAYRALLVPSYEAMSTGSMRRMKAFADAGLPVLRIGDLPAGPKYFAEDMAAWKEAREQFAGLPAIADIHDVPAVLSSCGILPRIRLAAEKDIMTAVRDSAEAAYSILYGYNHVIYSPEDPNPDEMAVSAQYKKGTIKPSYRRPGLPSRQKIAVSLEGTGPVWQMDPFSGAARQLPFRAAEGCMCGTVELEEDEMVILCLEKGKPAVDVSEPAIASTFPLAFHSAAFSAFEPDSPEEISFLRSHFEPFGKPEPIETPVPWPAMGRETFAGQARYEASLELPDVDPDARYVLEVGEAEDTFQVEVNGCAAPFPDQVMKRVDLTGLLHAGSNSVTIIVTSNLYNKVFAGGTIPMIGSVNRIERQYGIYETPEKKIRLVEYR